MSKSILHDLAGALLAAAGTAITQLQDDGFADEFGGASIAVAGVLVILGKYIAAEQKHDGG